MLLKLGQNRVESPYCKFWPSQIPMFYGLSPKYRRYFFNFYFFIGNINFIRATEKQKKKKKINQENKSKGMKDLHQNSREKKTNQRKKTL